MLKHQLDKLITVNILINLYYIHNLFTHRHYRLYCHSYKATIKCTGYKIMQLFNIGLRLEAPEVVISNIEPKYSAHSVTSYQPEYVYFHKVVDHQQRKFMLQFVIVILLHLLYYI